MQLFRATLSTVPSLIPLGKCCLVAVHWHVLYCFIISCTCVCVCRCVLACACVVYVCVCAHACACLHAHALRARVCVRVCARACVHSCKRVYIYIYIFFFLFFFDQTFWVEYHSASSSYNDVFSSISFNDLFSLSHRRQCRHKTVLFVYTEYIFKRWTHEFNVYIRSQVWWMGQ